MASVDVSNCLKNTTMTFDLKGVKTLKVRIAIGLVFIRFACWCMGCGVKIEGTPSPRA